MRPIIPPRKDAKIEQHGNRAEPLPRDETIRTIVNGSASNVEKNQRLSIAAPSPKPRSAATNRY